ncbi:hypothetical protein Bca4012_038487 [Brassica carinata]
MASVLGEGGRSWKRGTDEDGEQVRVDSVERMSTASSRGVEEKVDEEEDRLCGFDRCGQQLCVDVVSVDMRDKVKWKCSYKMCSYDIVDWECVDVVVGVIAKRSVYLQTMSTATQVELEQYSLRNRGLCLVPIKCTAGVSQSNGADIWTPALNVKSQSPFR